MDAEDVFRKWRRRPCICGLDDWEKCPHGAEQFRGHPSTVDPYAQWVRENLPPSSSGVTHIDDDHVVGNFQNNRLGFNTIVSLKSHNKTYGHKEKLTMQRHMDNPVRCVHLILDGNTPGKLKHYPVTDDGAPEAIRVSTKITWHEQVGADIVAKWELTEKQLIAGLLHRWWDIASVASK